MRHTLSAVSLLCAAALVPMAGAATDVRVVIEGIVERNDFISGTFFGVHPNDPVRVQIDLDSTNYLNSAALPGRTRGYRFGPANFTMTAGNVTVGLRPNVSTAYFCMRDNDPAVDGFFISLGTDNDVAIPLNMIPNNYGIAFLRTFTSSAIWTGLDIIPACRHYAFELMSSYNFTVEFGEFSTPLIFVYQRITLTHCASILTQPVGAQACANDPAAFSIGADGTDLAYQWQIESPGTPGTWLNLGAAPVALGCGGTAAIASGSGATPNIAVSPCAGVSDYHVRCMVSNPCGSVTSDAAALSIMTCEPPCPADFNQDGGVDGADVQAFFMAWEGGEASADVNQDGGVDGGDVEYFFTRWEAGGC